MEKEFRIGDVVTVGVRNQKGRVVDKYKLCGTYSIYKIHLFIDGTYRITDNFCGNLISAVFCGQLRTAEIKITEYYVK
jgi:hypothetical protein